MRTCVLASVLGALTIPPADASATQPEPVYASLAHRPSLPEGYRTVLRIYTDGVHQRAGDAVTANYTGRSADAYEHPSPGTPFGVWRVTRRSSEGDALIARIRHAVEHARPRITAWVEPEGYVFGSDCAPAATFRITAYNSRVAGRGGFCLG